MRERKFGRRVGIASLVALCAIAAFAVIGGTGLAKELANPGKAQYGAGGQYHGKVTICHKGHVTIRVAMVAWFRAHQHHGDTMGPCSAAAVSAATAGSKGKGKSQGAKGPKQTSPTVGTTQGAGASTTHGPPPGRGNGNGNANGHGKNG